MQVKIILFLTITMSLSGCIFNDVKNEIDLINNKGTVTGHISKEIKSTYPLVAQLYKREITQSILVSQSIHHKTGKFLFDVSPGEYQLLIFEDTNGDQIFQSTEKAQYAMQKPIIITTDQFVDLGTVTLSAIDLLNNQKLDWTNKTTNQALLKKVNTAKITSFDNPNFSAENAEHGLWQPEDFLLNQGGGLYFLEPYQKNKVPIIFVHGISGSPSQFQLISNSIDKSKYQIWLYHYPSGFGLNDNVELFNKVLTATFEINKSKPNDIIIIAHSMGGLLSRGLINRIAIYPKKNDRVNISTFISISTPWNGDSAAKSGVKYAPAIIPSWKDLVPNSNYINKLYQTRLPKGIKHHLIFGYKGKNIFFAEASSDGTVSLESQLYISAQQQAHKVYGLKETHSSILLSNQTVAIINGILNR